MAYTLETTKMSSYYDRLNLDHSLVTLVTSVKIHLDRETDALSELGRSNVRFSLQYDINIATVTIPPYVWL